MCPTSPYFNHTNNRAEQHLLEDLFWETIFLYGTESFYVPRNSVQGDIVYGEDPLKTFNVSYPIEIYNLNVQDFEGMKETFSKFGIEMKTEYTILLSRKTFLQRVGRNNGYERPLEGDLIWMPYVRGSSVLYEITFVNPEADFFLLGRQFPYYWQIKMEPFKYSQEIIQTGNPDIDATPGLDAYTLSFKMAVGGTGQYIVTEPVYQGTSLASATASAITSSWDSPSLTLDVTNIAGIFATNTHIKGATSGANYNLVSYDDMQDNMLRDAFDNPTVYTEGRGYTNFDEENPFAQI